ncbi:uncharacterized protein BXZ73DRAFT_82572 [Epithele typhae]|uniref:uncharacterized protein n=1 Tax=Epithele typhae TaxID=378194 RepID=UPI002007F271|nr:uncharacterized protein BXZ73DRAFT_82567 [Epithele typhae]XP_047871597.1 uncharacterized protein BXZ73DRAFT_82572 [Epithele typhae]KAH9911911.1 hypothetical protein BXZ73DRAFT_82567 [Epithele typhae]KAH9911918.1 hypothetical protein BXZ73DRAFT_82572 [Epithele typhae]
MSSTPAPTVGPPSPLPTTSDISIGDATTLAPVSDTYLNPTHPGVDNPSTSFSDELAALSELYDLGTDPSLGGGSAPTFGQTYGEMMVAATRRLVPPARWVSIVEEIAEYHRSLVIAELLDAPRPSTLSPRTHAVLVDTLFAGAAAATDLHAAGSSGDVGVGVDSTCAATGSARPPTAHEGEQEDRSPEASTGSKSPAEWMLGPDMGTAGGGAGPVSQTRRRRHKRKGKGKGKRAGRGAHARGDAVASVDVGTITGAGGVVGVTPAHPSVEDELPRLITPVHSDVSDTSDDE